MHAAGLSGGGLGGFDAGLRLGSVEKGCDRSEVDGGLSLHDPCDGFPGCDRDRKTDGGEYGEAQGEEQSSVQQGAPGAQQWEDRGKPKKQEEPQRRQMRQIGHGDAVSVPRETLSDQHRRIDEQELLHAFMLLASWPSGSVESVRNRRYWADGQKAGVGDLFTG